MTWTCRISKNIRQVLNDNLFSFQSYVNLFLLSSYLPFRPLLTFKKTMKNQFLMKNKFPTIQRSNDILTCYDRTNTTNRLLFFFFVSLLDSYRFFGQSTCQIMCIFYRSFCAAIYEHIHFIHLPTLPTITSDIPSTGYDTSNQIHAS